jgi:uncharacterized repeat protein (TIGR01451 family)
MNRLCSLAMGALALVPASPAFAGCAVSAQYTFAFSGRPAATLAYGSTYTYTAATSGGASQNFAVQLTQNGMTSTVVSSTQLPAIGTLVTGSTTTARDLVIGGIFGGRTTDITSSTRVATVTFTFTQPIRDFSMTVHDVDFTSGQYRDWLMITGTSASGTYTPVMSSPPGNGNATGAPRTATGSAVTYGPVSSPVSVTASQVAGVGASDNNSDQGNVTASFAQPVTSVTLRYGNAPLVSGESGTGQQAIGIAGIGFCPMPQIAVTKASAPMTGTLGAYNIPGNDILYTLTVTNAGASPVDASSIVLSDVLPAGVTFRNTVLDATSGTPFSISAGSSGVTLSAASPAYSNNGGSTWSYTPVSGYDANVRAVRVTPSGSMAANSSFAISFVARIN